MSSSQSQATDLPLVIVDKERGRRYTRGKFLGKGGFAKCYELIDQRTNEILAGKIVSKQMLIKKNQREKMTQEIVIHRELKHKHVVAFLNYFEDSENVYVVLELCARRSLMELHKRRRAVTEPEARYFTKQIVEGTRYLHGLLIIHRDLKLGNLFLNDDLAIKIGDFGLATKLDHCNDRKRTLCGTPNYIAPEMLNKKGHSFEVDIWAIGCILYTLLVGKPPFETSSLKDTYAKIRKNEYHIPSRTSTAARQLIRRLLAPDPQQRPSIEEVIRMPFFHEGILPTRLPISCLTMAPKFTTSTTQLQTEAQLQQRERKRAQEQHENRQDPLSPKDRVRQDMLAQQLRPLNVVPEDEAVESGKMAQQPQAPDNEPPSDFWLADMYRQLTDAVHTEEEKIDGASDVLDEALDPAAQPVFWISKWVDYSDKYGLGYQLCDNSVGVLFNDSTKIVLDGNGLQVQYMERDNRERYYTVHNYDKDLHKKVTLLKYFRTYMNDHLLKAGADMSPREGDELARLPCLRTWFRTRSAIVLHLNNGTLQINFFQDHTKVIICPLMGALTYINAEREFRTFKLESIKKFGCTRDIYTRLRYARTMVERLMTSPASSRPGSLSTAPSSSSATAMGPRHASNMNNVPPFSSASTAQISASMPAGRNDMLSDHHMGGGGGALSVGRQNRPPHKSSADILQRRPSPSDRLAPPLSRYNQQNHGQ